MICSPDIKSIDVAVPMNLKTAVAVDAFQRLLFWAVVVLGEVLRPSGGDV